MRILTFLGVACLSLLLLSSTASADLTKSFQFNGKGNWSIDGVGSNSTPVGDISAIVPTGSTVVKAFLYSSRTPDSSGTPPTVTFDGTTYSGGAWTALGFGPLNLQAYRTDVTAQIAAKVGGGSASPYSFTVNRENPNFAIDGEVLVVIYSNASEEDRTIALLDGFSPAAGNTTNVALASGLPDPTAPGFEALMSLGIGFGFQGGGQYSTVDVNGRRLTTSAGGQDDGGGFNGGLITVGGITDSTDNPTDPFALPANNFRRDDELYDLSKGNGVDASPFISQGDTNIRIDTRNPSFDDNIFFLGINITAEADVDPDPIPATGTGLLMAAGLILLGVRRFRK